jgi:exosortase
MLTTIVMNSGVQALPTRQDIAAVWENPACKIQFAVLACLLASLYGSILARLASQWSHDANFSHGFFVPAFSLYILWDRRETLARLHLRPSWTGVWLLLAGLLCLMVGVLGAELYLSRVSVVPVLGGLVVLFLGWRFLRAAAFPWLFLLLMIPLPALLFNQITFPLQIFASQAAANLLPVLGVPVLREGNVIHLPAMALEVADACSGIRSLMSLVTLAVMYGYVLENRRSLRLLLALAAVPIAVAANSLRIVGTGLLVQYWDPDKAEGFFHTFSGWIIFVVSILLLFAVRRVLHCMLDRTLDRTRAQPGTDPNAPDLMTKPTVETRS